MGIRTGFLWLWHFIRLGRPQFLLGGFIFHGLGLAMAWHAGAELRWPVAAWTQVVITAVQWMTHYSNDYFDLAADLANETPTAWAGGSRVLPDGLVRPGVALGTAVFLTLVAVSGSFVLAFGLETGPLTIPLTFLAILLAAGYSVPPLRLHSRGVGELTTSFLVPGLTPIIGYYMQAGQLAWLPILAVLPLCCLQFGMIVAVHLPDVEGDAAVGKRTLVVRLGREQSSRLYLVAVILAYLLLPLLVAAGLPGRVALAGALGLPLAAWQLGRMGRGAWREPAKWDGLAFGSIVLLLGTAVLEGLAFSMPFWQDLIVSSLAA